MPLAAHVQQSGRMRRIAVMFGGSEQDPQLGMGLASFKSAWRCGRVPLPAASCHGGAVDANSNDAGLAARASRNIPLFDHLVGAAEQRDRNGDAKLPGGLEIDDQFHFGGLLDRQVGRLLA